MVLSGTNCQKNTFHLPFIPLHPPIYPHHRLWLLTHLQHFSTFCSCHCNPGTTFNSSTKLSNPDKKLSPRTQLQTFSIRVYGCYRVSIVIEFHCFVLIFFNFEFILMPAVGFNDASFLSFFTQPQFN